MGTELHYRRHFGALAATLILFAAGCPADDTDETGSSDGSTSTTDTTSGTATSDTTTSDAATSDTETGTTTGTTSSETETGTDSAGTTTGPVCDENLVELPGDMLFPEGIAAHSNGTLYVGSITSGEVLAITPCTEGTLDVVENLTDGSDTMAALGMLVDETNSILWVCNSDITGTEAPSVQGFSLDDGTLLWTHLFDSGACNDVAFDGDGNLYATETFGSRIMRVDAADLLTDTDAAEWSTDTLYQVPAGAFGLNGIAWDGVDTIYTVNYNENEMYTTVIQGNGNAANPDLVDLAGMDLLGPDGMKLESPDNFLVVAQGANALVRVTIDAGGNTIAEIDNTLDVPTTAAVLGTDAWVIDGQLDHLLDPKNAGAPTLPFTIRRVSLQ